MEYILSLSTNKSLSLDMNNLKHKAGIYCIDNTITKERYIGSSGDCKDRVGNHFSKLRQGNNHNSIMQISYNWYTERYFKAYSLSYCPVEYLQNLEDWYIKTIVPEYNIAFDSRGGANSYVHKLRLRKLRLENMKDPEYVENWRKASRKSVEKLDYNTGNVIAEYPSASNAARELECSYATISNCASGKTYTAQGYRWKYKGKEELGSSTWKKSVLMIDKQTGEIMNTYSSIKYASDINNISRSGISDCLVGRNNTAGGYIWRYNL